MAATTKNTLVSIKIKIEQDESPDLSWLEPDSGRYDDCTPATKRRYDAQDAARLASYGDQWHMVGVYAAAEIHIPTPQGGSTSVQDIRSGGLWGIESDSDKSFFVGTAKEELRELKTELDALNIDLSGFDALAASAIDDME